MEKMMDHQYRKTGARNIYAHYNQMRAMLNALQINKKNILSTFPLSNRQNFENSGKVLTISVSELPEYCSSLLPAHAHKMVITTVCAQIDNCSCKRLIHVHQRASLR